MNNNQMKNKFMSQAAAQLKSSARINGFWNYWLTGDGYLHAEYQCGQGAYFILEKRDAKVYLIADQAGKYKRAGEIK